MDLKTHLSSPRLQRLYTRLCNAFRHSSKVGVAEINKHDNYPLFTNLYVSCFTESNSASNGYETFKRTNLRKIFNADTVDRVNNISYAYIMTLLKQFDNDIKNFVRTKDNNLYGSDIPIELYHNMTENEKELLLNTRYNRRHAIEIYNREDMKETLYTYMALRRYDFYMGNIDNCH